MTKPALTVDSYLAALSPDRREALEAIRAVINKNIAKEFVEGIQYGMIGWHLPHERYPLGYHCDPKLPLPFAGLASAKGHIGLYLFCIYCDRTDREQFITEWQATGKKLDMGAGCVRVKDLASTPLTVLGKAIKRATLKKFLTAYESALTETQCKARLKLAARLGVKVLEDGRTVKVSGTPQLTFGSCATKPATKKTAKKA